MSIVDTMFNLLPKQEKEAIRREYRLRLAVVILWFSFATFVIASLLLLPSFFLSAQKEKAAQARFETLAKSVARQETAGLGEVLLAAQSQLELLSREPPRSFLYELLIKIVSSKSAKISLESMTIRDAAPGKRIIHLTGVARDRGALLAFSRALESNTLFEQVELPISNLAKESEIPFSITGSGTF